jgi:hypothetical protein
VKLYEIRQRGKNLGANADRLIAELKTDFDLLSLKRYMSDLDESTPGYPPPIARVEDQPRATEEGQGFAAFSIGNDGVPDLRETAAVGESRR